MEITFDKGVFTATTETHEIDFEILVKFTDKYDFKVLGFHINEVRDDQGNELDLTPHAERPFRSLILGLDLYDLVNDYIDELYEEPDYDPFKNLRV
jgi:hypothetical protein